MKLAALALDYDGTIAIDGVFDPGVRQAIGEARQHGVAAILVTGRRLPDLREVAGDLTCFDAIVAENGAVAEFPKSKRRTAIGPPPDPAFIAELHRRGIPFTAGDCVLETDAPWAEAILEVIRSLEQPLVLAFNRGRVMVLPQGIAKSTGLRHALFSLRISTHNTVGIGDAENDHDLLHVCEVGAAVAWGSPALRAVADELIEGQGPPAVADYIRRVVQEGGLPAHHMARRHFMLGHDGNGIEVNLAARGRTALIAGEPGTGKSWLAGLLCEQSILQGYCLCIIDPEGDYRTLEGLPGGIVLGGDDPMPDTRQVLRALRYPDVSVVLDLSKITLHEKRDYVRSLVPQLVALHRDTGLPHGILLDEAHYFLAESDAAKLIARDLPAFLFVTYRISMLPAPIRHIRDPLVMVTRETDPREIQTLIDMCGAEHCAGVSPDVFRSLTMAEAVLLPGVEEAYGRLRRFKIGSRLTPHVRHRSKYLDVPAHEAQAFMFSDGGRPCARALTLKEFAGLLMTQPAGCLAGHLRRHDFSRWIARVFQDPVLANDVRAAEHRVEVEDPYEIAHVIARAVLGRYETPDDSMAAV